MEGIREQRLKVGENGLVRREGQRERRVRMKELTSK